MKIAISGKGGVGKSTLAAALSVLMARRGMNVLAVDADPDANLASALGMPRAVQDAIVPLSRRIALIEERTGAKVKQYGQVFKLNPEVSDVAGEYAVHFNGVALLVLGAIEGGGSGCACPENVFIRSLIADLVLFKDEAVVMDMEPGVEHLGRATASGVDTMIVVVEPGQRSMDSARRITSMAGEIGLKKIRFVANKITGDADRKFVEERVGPGMLAGMIPYCEELRRADRDGTSVLDGIPGETAAVFAGILDRLTER